MSETTFPDMPVETLLRSLNISEVSGEDHPYYKTYTVNLGENTFTIRKGDDLMWIDSEMVEQHGAEIMDYIGCYIDDHFK